MAGFRHYVELHFIVILWGFTATLGLLIQIPAVELVFFRTFLAFAGLTFLLLIKKEKILIKGSVALQLIGVGFVFAAHWILFFASTRVSNVSVTLVGLSTVTLWTAFLAPVVTRKKLRGLEIILGLVIIIGIYIVFEAEFSYRHGLIMAMLSAICAAIFMILNSKFTAKHNHFVIMNYEMLGACIAVVLFFPFYKNYFALDSILHLNPSLLDWIYILILAWVCTVYAYSTSVKLMKYFTPYSINLVASLEPVYGILLALIVFGQSERMTSAFYLGAVLIISAVVAYPIINRKLEQKRLLI